MTELKCIEIKTLKVYKTLNDVEIECKLEFQTYSNMSARKKYFLLVLNITIKLYQNEPKIKIYNYKN